MVANDHTKSQNFNSSYQGLWKEFCLEVQRNLPGSLLIRCSLKIL